MMLSLVLGACGFRSSELLESEDEGGVPDGAPADAGRSRTDAGSSRHDAAQPFPVDGSTRSTDTAPLSQLLQCGMNKEDALKAAVRHAACDGDTAVSAKAYFEAWEAGLFGTFEPGLTFIRNSDYTCLAWQCFASASTCDEHANCIDVSTGGGTCDAGERRCNGDALERCAHPDHGFQYAIDCSAFGAECTDGACVIDGCEFGGGQQSFRCAGEDIRACDGALTADCSRWRRGTSCAEFLIGGELPTRWCSPNGDQSGGYGPVQCNDGTIRFDSVGGRELTVDCTAQGYSGCNERGCVP